MRANVYGCSVIVFLLAGLGACDHQPATGPEGVALRRTGSATHEQVTLPFSARLQGVGAVPSDPNRCAPLVTAGNRTQGTMTHLGHVVGDHSQCIDPTGQIQDPLAYSDGRVTFTAANGDQLLATFAGTLIPTETPGFFAADNPFEIVGGTGRFEGASGGGRATGSLDLRVAETPIVLNLDGVLVLP